VTLNDGRGRSYSVQGLEATGTLGLLERAAVRGDLTAALTRLKATRFRYRYQAGPNQRMAQKQEDNMPSIR